MGWHIYLRESPNYQQRNKDGYWGWIRRPKESDAGNFLKSMGFPIDGDGTADDDGIAKFASKVPIEGEAGNKPRGGLMVCYVKAALLNPGLSLSSLEAGGLGKGGKANEKK